MNRPAPKIILVRPRDPNNIGAVARAMKNFGLTELAVIAPFVPHWNEAVSAVNAEDVLKNARVAATLSEAIADCTFVVGTADRTRLKSSHSLYNPRNLMMEWNQSTHKLALVFGSEKHGLTNDDLAHCHRTMSIPTTLDCPSMNLGQAVAICCYELMRVESPDVTNVNDYAPVGEVEASLNDLLDILREAKFTSPNNEAAMTQKLRQRLLQCQLTQHDVKILRGVLRQIQWRFENQRNDV